MGYGEDVLQFCLELFGNIWGILKETIGNSIRIGKQSLKRR